MGRTTPKNKTLQEYKVKEAQELLDFLLTNNVRKSRSAIKSLLTHKQITVNGKWISQYNHPLKAGDMVSVMKDDQSRKEKKLKGLKIVFEDDHIIVIDKEPGILSVSTDKEQSRTLYAVLNEYLKKKKRDARAFVLHRLDREVSGLMVFAKDAETQSFFQNSWDAIVLKHTYTAVVQGVIEKSKGTIVSWLTENKNFKVFSTATDNGGLKAVSHYKVIGRGKNTTMLEILLETRRKNQIRAQLEAIGHPIVGDKKYGAKLSSIKRMALHASDMVIKHPITGERFEFNSPVPKPILLLINTEKDTEQQ